MPGTPYTIPAAVTSPSGYSQYKDSQAAATVRSFRTSAGKAVLLLLDNSGNGSDSYFKLYDALAGSVTLGTTVPTVIIRVPAGQVYALAGTNIAFATAVSGAWVTTGGTGGTTPPTAVCDTKLFFQT